MIVKCHPIQLVDKMVIYVDIDDGLCWNEVCTHTPDLFAFTNSFYTFFHISSHFMEWKKVSASDMIVVDTRPECDSLWLSPARTFHNVFRHRSCADAHSPIIILRNSTFVKNWKIPCNSRADNIIQNQTSHNTIISISVGKFVQNIEYMYTLEGEIS